MGGTPRPGDSQAVKSNLRGCILGTTATSTTPCRGRLSRHHRSSEGQQEQVRAGQGNRPAAAGSRPVQRSPLSGRLRLHSADVLRRRRSARRAGARSGAGPSADHRRSARDRRGAHAGRKGLDDKIVAVSVRDPAFAEYTDKSQLPQHSCARSAAFSRTTKCSSTSRSSSRRCWACRTPSGCIREALDLYRQLRRGELGSTRTLQV